MTDPLQQALDEIEQRRAAGVADMGAELRQRLVELGAIALDTPDRLRAFEEVIEALTPPEFDLFPMPDECRIDPAGGEIRIAGAVVDQANRQVVGLLSRHLFLDTGRVMHEFLRVQRPYRGGGLAILLLDRSFAFYDSCDVRQVEVHAALETGRWYWARLGFDFSQPIDRAVVLTWANIALLALGETQLLPSSPARRLAQLGSGSPAQSTSINDLYAAMTTHVAAMLADPAERASYQAIERMMSARLGAPWLDAARFVECGTQNGIQADEQIPLGRAIMLTGPDWNGVFDLRNQGARDAFDEERNRILKKLAQRP